MHLRRGRPFRIKASHRRKDQSISPRDSSQSIIRILYYILYCYHYIKTAYTICTRVLVIYTFYRRRSNNTLKIRRAHELLPVIIIYIPTRGRGTSN